MDGSLQSYIWKVWTSTHFPSSHIKYIQCWQWMFTFAAQMIPSKRSNNVISEILKMEKPHLVSLALTPIKENLEDAACSSRVESLILPARLFSTSLAEKLNGLEEHGTFWSGTVENTASNHKIAQPSQNGVSRWHFHMTSAPERQIQWEYTPGADNEWA